MNTLRMEKPCHVKTAYTNEFLDKNVNMLPINPPSCIYCVTPVGCCDHGRVSVMMFWTRITDEETPPPPPPPPPAPRMSKLLLSACLE